MFMVIFSNNIKKSDHYYFRSLTQNVFCFPKNSIFIAIYMETDVKSMLRCGFIFQSSCVRNLMATVKF